MIPFNKQGFEKAFETIQEIKQLMDAGEYDTARRKIEDVEDIFTVNKDNKMPKPKTIWNDERFD